MANNPWYNPDSQQMQGGYLSSPSAWGRLGSGGQAGMFGALGSALGGMFSDYTNPADTANGYLNQIPGMAKPYYDPYITAGNQQIPQLQEQYGRLLGNPGGMVNQIGQGFQASPGYDWQKNQGMNAVNQAAAAGGMVGSPQAQQQAATMVNGLANQDYYNYLNKALGMYGQGLSGSQDMMHQGYTASNDLASLLASALGNQAQLGYAGQAASNQKSGMDFGSLLSAGAQFLPYIL
jgi:hypothetical protein